MFIEKPDHKVFTQIILCLYSYVFNILPCSNLIVVIIQITDQRLVFSPREPGLYTNITNDTSAIGNAFKIGGKTHIFDDESEFKIIFISVYFGQQIVVKTHRKHPVFINPKTKIQT